MKNVRSLIAVSAACFVAGCASTAQVTSMPSSIPPSLMPRAPELPPPEIVWPRNKDGRGITRNATTTYDYEDDREYHIRACFMPLLTYIYLQPGERHTGDKPVVVGDADNWKSVAKEAGDTEIIVVSGNAAGQRTSMMVATNMREYAFDLVATANCQRKIRFAYKPIPPRRSTPVKFDTYDPSLVNSAYEVSLEDGDRPWWMPVSVFDMGNGKTWIELPGPPGTVGMPLVLVKNGHGVKSPATTRVDGNFIEVDALFGEAELGLDGSVVTIRRVGRG